MSKQLKEIEDNIEALEGSKDQCLDNLQKLVNMLTEIKDDFIPSICEDYKTKKDASN